MHAEQNLVNFNFADDPDVPGAIHMNVVYHGGFDKTSACHRFCANLRKYLEDQAMSVGFEVVNGDPVTSEFRPGGAAVSEKA